MLSVRDGIVGTWDVPEDPTADDAPPEIDNLNEQMTRWEPRVRAYIATFDLLSVAAIRW